MSEIITPGEKLHVVERRHFEGDPARHFLGAVVNSNEHCLRIRGYVWVLNQNNEFIRRSEVRERIMNIGQRTVVNVLPAATVLEDVSYVFDQGLLSVTDGKNFTLDITEFIR